MLKASCGCVCLIMTYALYKVLQKYLYPFYTLQSQTLLYFIVFFVVTLHKTIQLIDRNMYSYFN